MSRFERESRLGTSGQMQTHATPAGLGHSEVTDRKASEVPILLLAEATVVPCQPRRKSVELETEMPYQGGKASLHHDLDVRELSEPGGFLGQMDLDIAVATCECL